MEIRNNTSNMNFKGGAIFPFVGQQSMVRKIASLGLSKQNIAAFRDGRVVVNFPTMRMQESVTNYASETLHLPKFIVWNKPVLTKNDFRRLQSLPLIEEPNSVNPFGQNILGILKMRFSTRDQSDFSDFMKAFKRSFTPKKIKEDVKIVISPDNREINIGFTDPTMVKHAIKLSKNYKDSIYYNGKLTEDGFHRYASKQVYDASYNFEKSLLSKGIPEEVINKGIKEIWIYAKANNIDLSDLYKKGK